MVAINLLGRIKVGVIVIVKIRLDWH